MKRPFTRLIQIGCQNIMSEHFLTDFGDTVSIGKAGEQRQSTFFGNDRKQILSVFSKT